MLLVACAVPLLGAGILAQTTGGGAPPTPGTNRVEIQELNLRISALESSRQDLSAWATIFIGIASLLILANVSLSVWQVGSLAQKEVDKVIAQYNEQFGGFLSHRENTVKDRLNEYDKMISDLSDRINDIAASLDELDLPKP